MKRSDLDFPSRPARSLDDVIIPDDAIKPDNELGRRSDEAAMDLAKWALLGIAGYGFLLKEIAIQHSEGVVAGQRYAVFLITGGLACGCCSPRPLRQGTIDPLCHLPDFHPADFEEALQWGMDGTRRGASQGGSCVLPHGAKKEHRHSCMVFAVCALLFGCGSCRNRHLFRLGTLLLEIHRPSGK